MQPRRRGPIAHDLLWGTKIENKGLAVAVLSDPSLPPAPDVLVDGGGFGLGARKEGVGGRKRGNSGVKSGEAE